MNRYDFTISRLDRLASRRKKKGQSGRGNQGLLKAGNQGLLKAGNQGLLKAVSEKTGVPHRTIQKLTSREIVNPTIRTLQPLYDFVITFDSEINELDDALTEIQQQRMKDDPNA